MTSLKTWSHRTRAFIVDYKPIQLNFPWMLATRCRTLLIPNATVALTWHHATRGKCQLQFPSTRSRCQTLSPPELCQLIDASRQRWNRAAQTLALQPCDRRDKQRCDGDPDGDDDNGNFFCWQSTDHLGRKAPKSPCLLPQPFLVLRMETGQHVTALDPHGWHPWQRRGQARCHRRGGIWTHRKSSDCHEINPWELGHGLRICQEDKTPLSLCQDRLCALWDLWTVS